MAGEKTQDDLTALLDAWRRGAPGAADALLPRIYQRLRRIAAGSLQGERPDHTLEPTALVHEVYLRLSRRRPGRFHDRAHFFAFAARTMRRILIDHARGRSRQKRGGPTPPRPLHEAHAVADLAAVGVEQLIALDDALRGLADLDAEQAQIVELRFFTGLSVAECAAVLGCSEATVARRWRSARAWLSQALRAPDG